MLGMCIYKKDNDTGTIYITASDTIKSETGNTWHAKLYRYHFSSSPPKDLIASGFARQNGTYQYRSSTFNQGDTDYHTNNRSMTNFEAKKVENACENHF